MRGSDGRGAYSENNSDTESLGGNDRSGFSGPLGTQEFNSNSRKPSKKSARFNLPGDQITTNNNDDDGYVEITLDIRDDSVAVHSVQTTGVGGGDVQEDPELSLLAKKTLRSKSNSFGSYLLRNTSSHIRQVSQELKRFTSLTRRPSASTRFDRTKSAAAHALKGLKFIAAKTSGAAGWPAIEKRFDDLTASKNGLLPSSLFGECIGKYFKKDSITFIYHVNFFIKIYSILCFVTGMNKESKEFAGEMFRALARRYNISGDSINKVQLKDFWEQISDESFDSRLQIFFDM